MIVRTRKSRAEEALLLRRRDVSISSLAASGKSRVPIHYRVQTPLEAVIDEHVK
jgi:hypothetical protein